MFGRVNPQWRLDHQLLYVNITLRGAIASQAAPREVKAALSASVHAAHLTVSRFARRVRQEQLADGAVQAFLEVISAKALSGSLSAGRAIAWAYAREAITRCHLEAVEPQLRAAAAEAFGREPASQPVDASSAHVLFDAMIAAQVPVTAPFTSEVSRVWTEEYSQRWGEIERGLEDTSSDEFDPSPTHLNEVVPLWFEYKRMRRRGEISDR
jgi:hypothetical protein